MTVKSNFGYLIVLTVLLIVSGILYLSGKSGSFKKSESEFAVLDTSQVSRIEILEGSEVIRICREGSLWKLNNEYPVRKDRIRGFLYLLSKIDVHSPVSNSLNNNITDGLLNNGRQVSIILNSGKEKKYRIYHDSLYSGASYAMMNHSSLPFRIQVPGYGFNNIYALFQTEEHYWRDNTLIAVPAGLIQSMSLEFSNRPASSFRIDKNEEGHFSFYGPEGRKVKPAPDTEKIAGYLSRFAAVRFEEYLTFPDFDERNESPFAKLKIINREGVTEEIAFFEKYLITQAGSRKKDMDRLFARIQNKGEWVVLKYMEIDPLLKEAEYFRAE